TLHSPSLSLPPLASGVTALNLCYTHTHTHTHTKQLPHAPPQHPLAHTHTHIHTHTHTRARVECNFPEMLKGEDRSHIQGERLCLNEHTPSEDQSPFHTRSVFHTQSFPFTHFSSSLSLSFF